MHGGVFWAVGGVEGNVFSLFVVPVHFYLFHRGIMRNVFFRFLCMSVTRVEMDK